MIKTGKALQQAESSAAVGIHTFPVLLSHPLFGCWEKRSPSQILLTQTALPVFSRHWGSLSCLISMGVLRS